MSYSMYMRMGYMLPTIKVAIQKMENSFSFLLRLAMYLFLWDTRCSLWYLLKENFRNGAFLLVWDKGDVYGLLGCYCWGFSGLFFYIDKYYIFWVFGLENGYENMRINIISSENCLGKNQILIFFIVETIVLSSHVFLYFLLSFLFSCKN